MSNQMFSSQENAPQEAEEYHGCADPREQQAAYQYLPEQDAYASSSYEQGYDGNAKYMDGEKLRPSQSPSTKQWIWILVIAIVLLSIGGSIINAVFGFVFPLILLAIGAYITWRLAFNQSVQLPPQTFTVHGQADLVIDNPFGSIRILRGTENIVEVRATRYYSSLFPSRPSYPLNTAQRENQVKVEVWNPQARRAFSLGDTGRVDLEIITPEMSDVHIRSDASNITLDGVRGQAVIQTNAGAIDVKNATLGNRSSVHTNAGTITVQNVTLEGDMRLETNAGTINFAGSVNPGSHYYFETDAGTIDVALPATSAFALDAKTDLGTVSNRFDGNIVGESPHATLHLRTNLGTITVTPL